MKLLRTFLVNIQRNPRQTTIDILKWALPLCLIGGLLIIGHWIYQGKQRAQVNQQTELRSLFLAVIPQVRERWQLGDIEDAYTKKGGFSCPNEIANGQEVDPLYFRCNSNYLNCFFAGRAGTKNPTFVVKREGKTYHVKATPFARSIPYFGKSLRYTQTILPQTSPLLPLGGVKVMLTLAEHPTARFSILLEGGCHQLYLPRAEYTYISHGEQLEMIPWVLEQDLFVDRDLVTWRDIAEWALGSPKSVGLAQELKSMLPRDKRELFLPADRLNLAQMRDFCQFQGRELIDAKVWMAATLYPLNADDPSRKMSYDSPFPWTKYAEHSFLERKVGQTDWQTPAITHEHCQYVYAHECQEKYSLYWWKKYQLPTWMGMQGSLGGHLEAMNNSLRLQENLKPSSHYFGLASLVHRLGVWAYWTGEGHDIKYFDFGSTLGETPIISEKSNELSVVFRCMKKEKSL